MAAASPTCSKPFAGRWANPARSRCAAAAWTTSSSPAPQPARRATSPRSRSWSNEPTRTAAGRERGHTPDRARHRVGLPDRRARRPGQGRRLLFADAATGAHSPALVSQGKIGAVIAAKPVERRQLLEEAAGISGLHARRKDAEQKLRAAEANLDAARRNPRRPGAARGPAAAAGARGRTLSQADRPDPRRRGTPAPCPLDRSRRAAEAALAEAKAAAERSSASTRPSPPRRPRRSGPMQALADRRNAERASRAGP